MRLQPVRALAAIGDKRHAQLNDVLHLLQHNPFHFFRLLFIDVEVKLVVHLQDHLASQALALEALVDAHHRQLDNVGGASLNRRVDGVTLGVAPHGGVVRVDIRQEAFPLEDRLHVTFLLGHLDTLVHVFFHTRVGGEITIYQFLRLRARNAQPFRQAEYGDAVDNPEVGGLRLTAHLARHLADRHAINLGGGSGMDIRATPERLHHVRIAAQVSHDTQLDLRIIRREEDAIGIVGNKRLTNLAA